MKELAPEPVLDSRDSLSVENGQNTNSFSLGHPHRSIYDQILTLEKEEPRGIKTRVQAYSATLNGLLLFTLRCATGLLLIFCSEKAD